MLGMIALFAVVVALLIAAIPMTLAVNLLGGDASLFKVLLANFLVGALNIYLKMFFPGIPFYVSFLLMIFVYKTMFDMGWITAFLAWLLQFVIAALLVSAVVALGIVSFAL